MSPIFANGNGIIVTTSGPGKLHLLTFASNGGIVNHVGVTETKKAGLTRFLISHSYTFTKFAFYWEGAGEAVYGTTESLVRNALTAKGWADSVTVDWGTSSFGKADVSAEAQKGVGRDGLVTAFIIPDNVL